MGKEIKGLIVGFITLLAIGAVLIIAWNILTFILLRWFGFRCYRITITSCLTAMFAYIVVSMPLACAIAKCQGDGPAILIGGIITGIFAFLVLVTMYGDGDKQEYHHCDICENW